MVLLKNAQTNLLTIITICLSLCSYATAENTECIESKHEFEKQIYAASQPYFSRDNMLVIYPVAARRINAEGVVLVNIYVNYKGSIEKTTLAKSSGDSSLDSAAAEAVLSVVNKIKHLHLSSRPACDTESIVKIKLPINFVMTKQS